MHLGSQRDSRPLLAGLIAIIGLLLGLSGCVGLSHAGPGPVTPPTQPTPDQLTVTLAGGGTGTVSSTPSGITCGTTCNATFPTGTAVQLTVTPGPGVVFAGWSGACSGATTTCTVTINASTSVTATLNPPSLQSINHIVFLAQENRSFDNYFGALREYWALNGFTPQAFNGLPQFNTPAGPLPTNPGCDPTQPPPADCMPVQTNPIPSYHLNTQCIENPSPSWNESHNDWNLTNPVDPNATLDGFVWTAAHDARNNVPPYNDVDGVRAMGFYDGNDLNYYYFMASSFATSDSWFSPVMSRTDPNRMYLIAATSQGHVYPLNKTNSPPLTAPTIFQELQAAGITWKIYVNSAGTGCADTDSQCLLQHTTITNFTFRSTIPLQNIASIKQYFADANNAALPNVALIEPAFAAGLDEHPTVNDLFPSRIQLGANYVSTLINAIMGTAQHPSPSWKDTAFILTFDEGGGLFDHVAPQTGLTEVSPDGIKPSDISINPPDICSITTGLNCNFTYSGFRVPLIVVSPFAKKNFVSHRVMDYTAILKLIETRFKVPALTKRDAAQPDMSQEFFDFTNPQWITPPPQVPTQNTNDSCTLTPPAPG